MSIDEQAKEWFRKWYDANRMGLENLPHERFDPIMQAAIVAFKDGFKAGRESVLNLEPYDKNKPRKPLETEMDLYRGGQKIVAIKSYRERLGAGLVEAYCAFNGITEQEHWASRARLS